MTDTFSLPARQTPELSAMYYDLDALEDLSEDLGLPTTRPSADVLQVMVLEGVNLEFHNLRDEEDTALGFDGTPWHGHGKLTFLIKEKAFVQLDELDVVDSIKSGTLLIGEEYVDGELRDRWLVHKDESICLDTMEPGEEIRHRRSP